MGIYSLYTLLCTLCKGRSKNINPTTFQLSQSWVVATSKCLEKSKRRECIYANTLKSSDNFQPGHVLLWFSYAIIYKLFFFSRGACLISSWIEYKLFLSTVSSFTKEFPIFIVHCMDIAWLVCPGCSPSYLYLMTLEPCTGNNIFPSHLPAIHLVIL